VVEHANFVMKKVRIGLVEVEPLLKSRLIIEVQRKPGVIVSARAFERPACLHHEHIVAAVGGPVAKA
jgi:hypothetical protein